MKKESKETAQSTNHVHKLIYNEALDLCQNWVLYWKNLRSETCYPNILSPNALCHR